LNPGDLISSKYRLQRLLGAGGMGSVWAARNELTDRDFAIKFLLPDLARNKEALQRFFLEARACGQIKHPAIVDVYDMGQAEDGSPYLVMELLDGEGFDQRLARERVFSPADAAAWIAFVARGLDEAHGRGLVHRDLKPGNIFFALDDRGDVMLKVLDFGVSKATGSGVRSGENFVKTTTGAVLGSPAYMSPEQAQGETDVDGRSDVWSLGVILYEALTGQVPFDAPNYNALMVAIMMRRHQPVAEKCPGVPPELSEIIDHALAKDKNHRIGTARELADRLEAVIGKLGATQNYPQFQPRQTSLGLGAVAPSGAGGYPPPPPPFGPDATGPQRPNSTTQGPWSDARPTLRRRSPVSPLVWIGLTVLGLAALVGGAFGFMYVRQPVAAVAGRSAAALTTGLSRLQSQLGQVEAEVADERARLDAEAAKAKEPPAAAATSTSSAGKPEPVRTPRTFSPRPRKTTVDPHGGVDSAGF
jgi:serine/threonine-protein kinase